MWESKILDVRMANLFQRDVSVISRHVNNVFKENGLDKESNLHFLQFANSDKPVAFYSLILLLRTIVFLMEINVLHEIVEMCIGM